METTNMGTSHSTLATLIWPQMVLHFWGKRQHSGLAGTALKKISARPTSSQSWFHSSRTRFLSAKGGKKATLKAVRWPLPVPLQVCIGPRQVGWEGRAPRAGSANHVLPPRRNEPGDRTLYGEPTVVGRVSQSKSKVSSYVAGLSSQLSSPILVPMIAGRGSSRSKLRHIIQRPFQIPHLHDMEGGWLGALNGVRWCNSTLITLFCWDGYFYHIW